MAAGQEIGGPDLAAGIGRLAAMATNEGRFWFAVPSP